MSESNKSPAELFLEKAESSGLMNTSNREGLLAVAEMLRHPYSLEQMKSQIERAELKRKKAREEKLLKDCPKNKCFWTDDLNAFPRRLEYFKQGMEAKVYFYSSFRPDGSAIERINQSCDTIEKLTKLTL